jgi:hypothetical protein
MKVYEDDYVFGMVIHGQKVRLRFNRLSEEQIEERWFK